MTTPPPVQLDQVVKRFDDVSAVDGVDLIVGPAELLALVGPSGCGKSTLLRSIAGLLDIDSGRIQLGADIVDDGTRRLPPERRSTGLVFQEHSLFPHLTVADNVAFGLRDTARQERDTVVDAMLELVSLSAYGARFPHELSGGERQRVAVARALAPQPSLMLFDEPFASLDQNLRMQLRRDVCATLRATGTPAIFVTHDQQEALAIADRVAVMRQGRLVQVGTPAEVYHQPVDTFTGVFMGQATFLPIGADGSTILGPVEVAAPTGGSVAMVRPDDVVFSADEAGDACVTAVEYHGSEWHVQVALDDSTNIAVTMDHLLQPVTGQRGRVSIAPGHRQVPVQVPVADPAGRPR